MGKASREKGKRGEREFAALCRKHGFSARRGQQYSGEGGEDVVGLPGVHVEVKRVERLNLEEAMEQSVRDSHGAVPIVAHRRNGKKWMITQNADDWLKWRRRLIELEEAHDQTNDENHDEQRADGLGDAAGSV